MTAAGSTRRRRTALATLAATWLGLVAAVDASAASIFDGDPIDPSTGAPMVLQSGAPRVSPGVDGRYGDGGDIFDPATIGDVDLVLRTGGVFGGGPFPPPAGSIATAPGGIAGGFSAGGSGVAYDLVASDGATSPAGGYPLLTSELDGRGALILAFADLDGDGVIGPTDADGTTDNQIERQEILTPAGRGIGAFVGGVASGTLGVSFGAPASDGGLGVVVVGGAATGAVAPLFLDGAWVSTLLPFMPSEDPGRILGGNPAAPDPDYIADIELELGSDRHFVPSGSHPTLGTPFAIPLDGTSFTVDLARFTSGEEVGIGLGVLVPAAGYVAVPGRRLVRAIDPDGNRVLVDATSNLLLDDDGPGGSRVVYAFAVDLFGNPTDPVTVPESFTVEVGPSLRIVSPDVDADPSRETFTLTGTEAVSFLLDDAGGVGDGAATDRLVATVAGVPTAALRVDLTGGAPVSGVWSRSRTVLKVKDLASGRLRIAGEFESDPASIDPEGDEVEFVLTDDGGETIYARTLPAGSLVSNAKGTSFRYRELPTAPEPQLRVLTVRRRPSQPNRHKLRLRVQGLDLTAVDPQTGHLTQTVRFGATLISSSLDCVPNRGGTTLRCGVP